MYIYIYIYIYIYMCFFCVWFCVCVRACLCVCARVCVHVLVCVINPLTPNDHYSGRTASLTSKLWILYIYSTNKRTEYFKHGMYSPCFSLQNAVMFIILTYLVPILFTFYIQSVLKFKKNNSSAKRLNKL